MVMGWMVVVVRGAVVEWDIGKEGRGMGWRGEAFAKAAQIMLARKRVLGEGVSERMGPVTRMVELVLVGERGRLPFSRGEEPRLPGKRKLAMNMPPL
jgi:hypothetical protein